MAKRKEKEIVQEQEAIQETRQEEPKPEKKKRGRKPNKPVEPAITKEVEAPNVIEPSKPAAPSKSATSPKLQEVQKSTVDVEPISNHSTDFIDVNGFVDYQGRVSIKRKVNYKVNPSWKMIQNFKLPNQLEELSVYLNKLIGVTDKAKVQPRALPIFTMGICAEEPEVGTTLSRIDEHNQYFLHEFIFNDTLIQPRILNSKKEVVTFNTYYNESLDQQFPDAVGVEWYQGLWIQFPGDEHSTPLHKIIPQKFVPCTFRARYQLTDYILTAEIPYPELKRSLSEVYSRISQIDHLYKK